MKKILILALLATAVLSSSMSDDIKTALLNKHNELRNKVATGGASPQPSASNMLLMQWNNTIAESARKHAEKNKFEHSKDSDRPGLGENLWAMSTGGTLDADPTANLVSGV